MSVGLYLMTSKGLAVLRQALASGAEIAHVTTAPAAGMKDDSHQEIALLAKAAGVTTFLHAHPPTFTADWSIAAGWRWLLDAPNLVVLHDSLLPRYRGFSPLVTALCNGDPAVGVTAFLAVEEPDAGPIIAQRSLAVSYPARVAGVIERLHLLYADLTCEVLAQIPDVRYAHQDHREATYSVWRDEIDFRIDWDQDDRSIVRLVDAASDPFGGAWTSSWGTRVTITEAVSEPDVRFEQRHPGKVAFVRGGCPVVVCGSGMVRVLASSVEIPFRTRLV